MSSFSETVDIDGIIFEVEGDYTAGDPGIHTRLNGDPGDPPTDAEVEIESCIAYIKCYGDSEEQLAVDGEIVLDFSDKWTLLEEKLLEKLKGGDCFNY